MTSPDLLERALGKALSSDAAPRPGDADLLARLIDGAVVAPPPPAPAIAKVPFILGGAGAAIVAAAMALWPAPAISSAPPVVPPAVTAVTQAPAPVVDDIPSVSVESLPATPSSAPTVIREPGATELFARANDARRRSQDTAAIADYQALQRRFPNSPEARASLVALGRLLLDQRHDDQGALEQFDRYLQTGGALEEEALIGRALALEHLGRRSEEERAWHAVLDRYPDSIYAGEARSRLASLGR
jgi:TolA-binding protein